MLPVVTVEEMRDIDARSEVGVDTLIRRAGYVVAREAKTMMGGSYGRRVTVVAGPGNNGADGRVAAELLRRWGCRVVVVAPGEVDVVPPCDLVIDAAYGTGFRGDYRAPSADEAMVLAVDIPSGVDGNTGAAGPGAVSADRTITFAAFKPGHFLGDGPSLCGELRLADIGLEVGTPDVHLVDDGDLSLVPTRERSAHKWAGAVAVLAGSPEMMGAGMLATRAAQRAGASTVRWMTPCASGGDMTIAEALTARLPGDHWVPRALELCERAKAVVVGPGLGRDDTTLAQVLEFLDKADKPAVADADALSALAGERGRGVLKGRTQPTVLTPHEGEFARFGSAVGPDRIADVRRLATDTGATVLLKGPTTVVAAPDGKVLLSNSGSVALATAGTGDVLSGVIGAFLAKGADPSSAAALGAHVHGRAAALGRGYGLLAGDLPDLVADFMAGRRP